MAAVELLQILRERCCLSSSHLLRLRKDMRWCYSLSTTQHGTVDYAMLRARPNEHNFVSCASQKFCCIRFHKKKSYLIHTAMQNKLSADSHAHSKIRSDIEILLLTAHNLRSFGLTLIHNSVLTLQLMGYC